MIKFLWVFLGFSLATCIVEYQLRLEKPEYNPSVNLATNINSFGVRVNTPNFSGRFWKNTGDYNVPVVINEFGYRESKNIRSITRDDIIVLGDSFPIGWGVKEEERFTNVIENKIGKKTYNLSVSADDIQGYIKTLSYIESLGIKVKKIIIGITFETDVKNYLAFSPSVNLPSTSPAEESKVTLSSHFIAFKDYLKNKIAIYNYLTAYFHNHHALKAALIKFGIIKDNIEGMVFNQYDQMAISSSINLLKDFSKKYKVIVLLIPSRGIWAGKNIETENLVYNEFVDKLAKEKINFVDPRASFEKNHQPLMYHFKNDPHWNRTGHELIADLLISKINELKW